MLKQVGVTSVDSAEHLLCTTYAMIDLPLLKGGRIGIVTIGGGYGVLLSDALSRVGLDVPELSQQMKSELRGIVTETRASVRNPIDLGATWPVDIDLVLKVSELILGSDEVDGLVIHDLIDAINGSLWAGSEDIDIPLEKLENICSLSERFEKPLLICSPIRSLEMDGSELIRRRVFLRLEDIAVALSSSLFRRKWKTGIDSKIIRN